MIEKIVHFIWIQGYENIPPDYIKNIEHNKTILNDYIFNCWDDDKIIDLLINQLQEYPNIYNAYKESKIYAQKADIARYCIIYLYGGIYLDTDCICYKKLDIFLKYNFFCAYDGSVFVKPKIINGVFGSIKKGNIMLSLMNNLQKINIKLLNSNFYLLDTAGMTFFYNTILKNSDYNNDKIIDRVYLFPNSSVTTSFEEIFNKDYIYTTFTNKSSWISYPSQILHKCCKYFNDKIYTYYLNKYSNNKQIQLESDFVIKKYVNTTLENLIVVVHPVDDILFFGDFLIENSHTSTVLCITNSSNIIRRNEFINTMNEINCNYEMWDFTDCKSLNFSEDLKDKLTNICEKYKNVYTYSLSGETGNIQHIQINKILYSIVLKNFFVCNLCNFKNKMSIKKKNLLKNYRSQKLYTYFYYNISSYEDFLQLK
jgi:hypothetical protein